VKVEVLGTGCAKCRRQVKNVEAAIRDTGIDVELVKIDDIAEIMERGVLLTPALAIDGEIRVSGRVADVAEIKAMLQGA